MPFKNEFVTVFGGSGFIGRHVVRLLAKKGYRIKVACRRPWLANYLYPLGDTGQIQIIQANLRIPSSIEQTILGSSHVINLTGILYEKGKQKFESVHHTGLRTLADSVQKAGVPFTHISALGACSSSASCYSRTKAEGEKAVLKILPNSTIFRPSLVFGAEDNFFNKFSSIACCSPFLPLIAGGNTKFQPVFVGDLTKAIVCSVEDSSLSGKIYEIGGQDILSFRQCIEIMLRIIDRKRFLLPIPVQVANLFASLLSFLPKPPITRDQIALLKTDSILSAQAIQEKRTLEAFKITPETLDAILPSYLWPYRKGGQFFHPILSDDNKNYLA